MKSSGIESAVSPPSALERPQPPRGGQAITNGEEQPGKPGGGHRGGQPLWRGMALVVMLALACYANSLSGEFVMDDTAAIVQNKDLRPDQPLWRLFHNDYWGEAVASDRSHKSYRPLTVLTFRLNYQLHELRVWGYHAGNIVLHAVASAAVVLVASRVLLLSEGTATVAGLLFASHPVHTEAVSSIVGRAEPLSLVFVCAGLWLYQKALDGQGWHHAALALVCAVVATLCKETGATVLGSFALLEVLDLTWGHGGNTAGRVGGVVRLLAVVTTLALIAGGRLVLTDYQPGPTFSRVDNPFAYLPRLPRWMSYAYLHWRYAVLLVVPENLSCDYSFDAIPAVESWTDSRLAGPLVLYAGLAFVIAVALVVQDRAVSLCVAFTVLPFVPASNALIPVATTLGERLLYAPSMGASCLSALIGTRIARGLRVPVALRAAVVACLVAYFAQRTVERNVDWQSPVALFEAGVAAQPRSCKLHVCLGTAYLDEGRYDWAVREAEKALEINPDYPGAEYVLGLAYDRSGKAKLAKRHYVQAIKLGQKHEFVPDVVVSAMNNLGTRFMGQRGNAVALGRAEKLFRRALEIDERRHSLHSNLGEVLKLQNRHAEAVPHYRRALEVYEDATVHNNLAVSLFESQGLAALDEVEMHYARAVELVPEHRHALDNLAQVYSHQRRYHKAIPLLRRLVRLWPEHKAFAFRLRTAMQARRGGQGVSDAEYRAQRAGVSE